MTVYCKDSTVLLDLNMTQNASAKARITDSMHEKGLLATRTENSWHFEPWSFDATTLKQNGRFETVLLTGTAFNGVTLSDLLSGNTTHEAGRKAVAYVCDALENAIQTDCEIPAVGAGGMLIEQNNGVVSRILFLPQQLFTLAVSGTANEERALLDGYYKNPQLKGDAAIQFIQTVLTYQALTGKVPFPQKDSNLRIQDIQDRNFIPLTLARPDIAKTQPLLAFFVDNALRRKAKVQVHKKSASADKLSLTDTIAQSITESEEKNSTEKSAQKNQFSKTIHFPVNQLYDLFADDKPLPKEFCENPQNNLAWKSFNRRLKIKRWFRKHITLLSIIAAVIAVITFLVITVYQNKLSHATTAGLNSQEVTQQFFSAYSNLDIVTLQASSSGSQMRRVIDMLSGFYVTAKTMETYNGSGKTVPPADWFVHNRGKAYNLYGLSHFYIDGTQAQLHPDIPTVRTHKQPVTEEEGHTLTKGDTTQHTVQFYFIFNEGFDALHVLKNTDTVTLTYTGDRWQVTALEEDSVETISDINQFYAEYAQTVQASQTDDIHAIVEAFAQTYPWASTWAELEEAKEYIEKNAI